MPSSISSSDHYPLPAWGVFFWRKSLVALLTFVVLWFVGDRLGGLALQMIADRSQFRFAKLYAGGNDYDYVVLGSSRGVNSFYVPELNQLTGLNGINLSYNGMSMLVAESLFRDYLQLNEAPRLLLLEITNLNTRPYELIKNMRPFLGRSLSLPEAYYHQNLSAYLATQISHLYRFNGELYLRLLFYMNKDDQSWINRYSMDEAFAADYSPAQFGRGTYGLPIEVNLEALQQILSLAEEKDVAIKLIVGPYFPKHIENVQGYFEWKQEVEQYLEGVPILDLSRVVRDPKAFADPIHLNKQGTEVLNQIWVNQGVFESH